MMDNSVAIFFIQGVILTNLMKKIIKTLNKVIIYQFVESLNLTKYSVNIRLNVSTIVPLILKFFL